MIRRYRWQFHFNAMHNMKPEQPNKRHPHSFLLYLWVEIIDMDMEEQNLCEKEIKSYLSQYNGTYLNELNVFWPNIPTVEVICEKLYPILADIVSAHGMKLIRIEVGDSPISMYTFGEEAMVHSSGD